MTTFSKLSALALLVTSLTACGFSETTRTLDPVSYPVAPDELSFTPSTTNVLRDGQVVSNAGDTQLWSGLSAVTARDNNTQITARASSGQSYAFYSATNGLTNDKAGGVFGRNVETKLPTTGAARFTGDYKALVIREFRTPNQYVNFLINGDSTIDVDLDKSTVSGSITNRVFSNGLNDTIARTGRNIADVTLNNATLNSDGSFSGTTTGGRFNANPNWTAEVGVFGGVVGGKTGEEAVGGVQISHGSSGTTYEERGVFLAN